MPAGMPVASRRKDREEVCLKQELYFIVYSFAAAVLLYAAQLWMKLA